MKMRVLVYMDECNAAKRHKLSSYNFSDFFYFSKDANFLVLPEVMQM